MNTQNHYTLPEGWEMKRLEEVTSLVTNGFVGKATNHYTDAKDGVLYIQGYNVQENSYNFNGIRRVTKEFHAKNKKSQLQEGDLLTIQTGEVGLTTIVPLNLVGSNCHALIISRFKQTKCWPWYYVQYFNSPIGRRELKSIETGSTMKHINVGDLIKWTIPLPPLPEQRQIAAVLGTWDRAIEQTTELLKALRTRHRGLMQQLLTGKKRLPGFTEEWNHIELSEVFERVNRRNAEGNTNVLTISAQHGLIGQERYFKKNIASEDVANYFLLHRGEFAYNKSYSTGYPMGAIKRLDQYDRGILSPLYICFRLRDEAENEAAFFTHFFEAGCLNQAIGEIAQEGARNHGLLNIGVGDFFALRLVIPPSIEEQRAIARVLDTSLQEIRQNEARLDALREQKRGLMQCLLTGKIRVSVA